VVIFHGPAAPAALSGEERVSKARSRRSRPTSPSFVTVHLSFGREPVLRTLGGVRPVDIIFLDAGGTLLRPEPGVGRVYSEAGGRHGVTADSHALEAAFLRAFRDKKRDSIPQDREWWRSVVAETFRGFGEPHDPAALFDDLYGHFARPDAWRLFPTAKETLRELRARGYRTGLISNWDDRLPDLLEGLGLLDGLDPVVVSYRVGAEKPAPRIYETALREAGVDADRALMVGDDREADFDGARACGMRAILLDRNARADGDGTLRSLSGLLRLFP
jgi:putative hydrolase of the HAD superfamily